ncbi:MAG: TonB-dependent receptor plug domain-containing protein [Bacteroidetes bacterium]|nr:TonB-dependent receptor plug domain-containing protein [Bacteroidota bacterium]
MTKKFIYSLFFVVIASLAAYSQNANGAIKIVLKDKANKETIPFANVVAYKNGVQIAVATTNMDGEAFLKPLDAGKYDVKGVYVGYQASEVKGVVVGEGKTAYVTIELSNGEGVKLDEVEVVTYQVPLVDPDTKSGQTVTREEYQSLASKDVNSVAATTAGVYQSDVGGSLNVRGGRNGSTTYFVDGVKVFGTPNLPQQGIEQLNVVTGGVPAMYGDATSGIISITTRGPQSKYFGGVELISSQLTDPYGYNSLGFSAGGPLYKKKDSTKRTVLGFFVSGQGNYTKDPSPQAVPIYIVNDDKLAKLKSQPFQPSPSGTGFVNTSQYVTMSDMHTQKWRPNAAGRILAINAKIDYAPTPLTNLTVGGYLDYNDNRSGNVVNYLFNSNNNSVSSNRTLRGTFAWTQKFSNTKKSDGKSQSLIQNPFFRLLFSYDNQYSTTQSDKFKDNVFDYGYVGKFDRTYLTSNYAGNYQFTQNYEGLGNAYVYTGATELPVKFTPSSLNPDLAAYTSYIVNNLNPKLQYMDYIAANGGLRNGDLPLSIYSLYRNFGTPTTDYFKQSLNQYRVTASFNADIKNHALTFGFEMDQRVIRSYDVYAVGLWTRMRQIVNQHLQNLDTAHPILNTQFSGLVPYYSFNNYYDQSSQTQFSEQILNKLGLPKNYTGFVNTDALTPDQLNLHMFSASDLFGNSINNSLVSYNGYTPQGDAVSGITDINKFLNAKDANGRNLYPIGAFMPNYSAVYIMDKFDFKDIKFNVGLRIDRYDANQPVLKDKYALHDLAHVSDLGSLNFVPGSLTESVPNNVPKDAAVYISNNLSNGGYVQSITGYREGDQWYNAAGSQISDPSLIQSSDGRVIPLFKDIANYNQKMSPGGFTSYSAAINVLPRIAFSFPISTEANFFAHYDILTQRPNYSVLNPLQYYYLDVAGGQVITNPNQRPQQTVDYELGFSQILNERKNASLTITSFYREMRNMINQRNIVGAYPSAYVMYDNIDFSTVKGVSVAFDFRRTGGSRIKTNYTLQFADGSGSNANSGANLASSGQPMLRVLQPLNFDQRHTFVVNYDYRFGGDKDYRGPSNKIIKMILQNVGFNANFTIGSGTPYTRWSSPVPLNGNGRSNISGEINGSRLPWNARLDLRVDKNFELTWGGKKGEDSKKTANLNVYVQVLNALNRQNVLGVWNFTGNPSDDGYLNSYAAQQALAITNSQQAFKDMYSIRMNNPANLSLPRQIRIGVLFEF